MSGIFHLFLSRLPIDWKKPLPYLLLMICQIISASSVQAIYIATSSLYVGVCFILMAFNNDIRIHLRHINRMIIKKKSFDGRKKVKNIRKLFKRTKTKEKLDQMIEMKRKLLELIEFHANVRQ